MTPNPLILAHQADRQLEIGTREGAVLWRYVYRSDAPGNEAPRPYVHPLYSKNGDVLTNFRPNDHPWHHGLSLTLTCVDETNFWGGPTHRAEDGYRWRNDHGCQVHRAWESLAAERLVELIDWQDAHGVVLLNETRTLETSLTDDGWALRWSSELRNQSGRELSLGNYHARGGLAGSHYTGLQFRGARDLLDEHGDATIGIRAAGELAGESAVHSSSAAWMEWSCQHDGTLRRTRLRFENLGGDVFWFVRAKNPVAAFAFHRDRVQRLPVGGSLRLDHRLTITPG